MHEAAKKREGPGARSECCFTRCVPTNRTPGRGNITAVLQMISEL